MKYLVNVKCLIDEVVEVTADNSAEATEIARKDFFENDIMDWLEAREISAELTDNLEDKEIFRKIDKYGLVDEEDNDYGL